MKILLIFTLCLISDGEDSKTVTGYSGGGVLIKCKYHTGYTQNKKYFCKNSTSGCSDQMKINAKDRWVSPGRFSLYDDTRSAEFRVMMRKLTVQDTGTYHCGVDEIGKDNSTRVQLKVIEDLSHERFISKTVHVGGDLNISCKYPESLRSNPKFLCNTSLHESVSFYKESVKESMKYVNMGKFSLYDDGERRILTVSIRNVTERDAGEYWCGAEAAWESDQGYKVYFTQIILTVT
ncbi:polymeric immunoglobulin receptor-like isoform X4, partial [Clarias magur]